MTKPTTEDDLFTVFIRAAFDGRNSDCINAARQGVNVNGVDPLTGLAALHIAVGTNNMELTKVLVEEFNAEFFSDEQGRWPTLIAAELPVSEQLSDYVLQAEYRACGYPFKQARPAPIGSPCLIACFGGASRRPHKGGATAPRRQLQTRNRLLWW